ncbi:unknown [Paraprevotella clara CAG:116]|nr:unknown [Paraprevotella clara CAG:116]
MNMSFLFFSPIDELISQIMRNPVNKSKLLLKVLYVKHVNPVTHSMPQT